MSTDADILAQLTRLTDHVEIHDCIQRYARGMDRQDRALVRSAYHDDGVDDHIGFVGPVEDLIDWAFAYHSIQTRYFSDRSPAEWNADSESLITEDVIAMLAGADIKGAAHGLAGRAG